MAWTSHFQKLAKSLHPGLQELQQKMATLSSASFQKVETFLDVPFTEEEVECTLQKKMKLKKAFGPDDLTTEHLRYGGQTPQLPPPPPPKEGGREGRRGGQRVRKKEREREREREKEREEGEREMWSLREAILFVEGVREREEKIIEEAEKEIQCEMLHA